MVKDETSLIGRDGRLRPWNRYSFSGSDCAGGAFGAFGVFSYVWSDGASVMGACSYGGGGGGGSR